MENYIWKTKDGRSFTVKEMETDHIKNCIKFFEKQCKEINDNLNDDNDWTKDIIIMDMSDYIEPFQTMSKTYWIEIFQQELARRVKEDEYE